MESPQTNGVITELVEDLERIARPLGHAQNKKRKPSLVLKHELEIKDRIENHLVAKQLSNSK